MCSGIYKIVNIINGKFYIGSTKNIKERCAEHFNRLKNNSHHSVKFQNDYDIYGRDAFVCEVIEEIPYEGGANREKMYEREQYWIDKLDAKNKGYNIADSKFGDALTHHPLRENIIERITNTARKNISEMTPEERKEKWGQNGALNGMYGRHRTDEERKHLSEVNKGRTPPNKGKHHSEETKKKLSKARIESGIAKGEKNPFYGKHHSEETKKKLSEYQKGKKPSNRRKVLADGILFESVHDCARYYNVCDGTVIYRIKSTRWNLNYVN